MKYRLIIYSLFISLSFALYGSNDLYKQANTHYSKGEYQSAVSNYEQLIDSQVVAPEIYYNLGNSYYKLGEVSKSILNYERALRLKPNYDDAKNNLEYAQLKVVDNIIQTPPFFIIRWVDVIMKLCSTNQWFSISVVFFFLSMILVLLFIFGRTIAFRKTSFYFGLVFLIFSMTTLVFSGIRKDQLMTKNEAIIMSGIVTIKSSPDKSGTDLFQLHEGTKVIIKSELGSWTEIKIGNGSIGWLENENIEKI